MAVARCPEDWRSNVRGRCSKTFSQFCVTSSATCLCPGASGEVILKTAQVRLRRFSMPIPVELERHHVRVDSDGVVHGALRGVVHQSPS